MPFFMTDDQFHLNQKATALADMAMDDDLSGLAALGMWTMAGSWAQAAGTDGQVAFKQLVKFTLNPPLARRLGNLLSEKGLWHSTGHECQVCPQPTEPGDYVYHDWFQMKYDRAKDVRLKRSKSQELKDPALIAAVWARDCIDDPAVAAVGRCRYCQTELKRKDTRSEVRPEMDHVDPKLAVGVTNVVLSCNKCNRTKGMKTPEQAGMTLHPAPRHHQHAATNVETPQAAANAGAESKAPSVARNVSAAEADVHGAADSVTVRQRVDAPPQTTPNTRSGTKGGQPDEIAILGRARGHERAGRAGQGKEGLSEGDGQGSGRDGQGAPQGSRRRRGNRGRGSQRNQSPSNAQRNNNQGPQPDVKPRPKPQGPGRAGEAPDVLTGGRYGSPYFGWHGRPSVVEESVCSAHGLDLPCRKCQGGQ